MKPAPNAGDVEAALERRGDDVHETVDGHSLDEGEDGYEDEKADRVVAALVVDVG